MTSYSRDSLRGPVQGMARNRSTSDVGKMNQYLTEFKDRAHLSTFKIFIFEKFSCFIVLVVFLVIVQSSELISV